MMKAFVNFGPTLSLLWLSALSIAFVSQAADPTARSLANAQERETKVSIVADRFLINGERPTKIALGVGRALKDSCSIVAWCKRRLMIAILRLYPSGLILTRRNGRQPEYF